MTRPFIIYALPRSRTLWLSKFLTYGPWKCGHDIVTDYFTPESLQHVLTRPYFGTVETGMVEGWRVAKKLVPYAKIIVIKRSPLEVINSLTTIGIPNTGRQIFDRADMLDEVSNLHNVMTFNYNEFNNEGACSELFEYCLDIPFDRDWWLGLKDANIQLDVSMRIEKLKANQNAIRSLRALVAEITV